MPYITSSATQEKAEIYYEDYGKGQPVILIHGWPLSHKAWEQQAWKLVESGYRCITYDRRGFGASSKTWDGYDYTSLATDLKALIDQLSLENVVIVGFSMGGGEVVRYLTKFGSSKIAKAALVSSIIPLVAKKEDNPDGVPQEDLDGIMKALQNDRVGFLKNFHRNFYNYDNFKDKISEAQLHYDWSIASHASPRATIQAAKAWAETDFRSELTNVDVPTLIIHGTGDNIVPKATSGDQAASGIPDNTYKTIDEAPHGLNLTHADTLNDLLISFLNDEQK